MDIVKQTNVARKIIAAWKDPATYKEKGVWAGCWPYLFVGIACFAANDAVKADALLEFTVFTVAMLSCTLLCATIYSRLSNEAIDASEKLLPRLKALLIGLGVFAMKSVIVAAASVPHWSVAVLMFFLLTLYAPIAISQTKLVSSLWQSAKLVTLNPVAVLLPILTYLLLALAFGSIFSLLSAYAGRDMVLPIAPILAAAYSTLIAHIYTKTAPDNLRSS
ncbi:hypothetical protein A3709_20760 [Halioglobus sp. HI00S01]|uniref:hypothetical protein n=1 Tax=Halioglobus sp. HI00S01 TaxID=1822214 RepID=UPI0007C3BC4C|nr:hypothetical protein [Halioglobus sp. HI00S01]KZX58046.1 hypothetical protein A3709_20760 [Halioglobus sp. HI00S01]